MGKAKATAARVKAPRAPAGARGGRARPNPNPFEVKVNRQKFQVLGRKTRHDVGLPGVSRARAIQKVSGTPLPRRRPLPGGCHLPSGRPLPRPRVRAGTGLTLRVHPVAGLACQVPLTARPASLPLARRDHHTPQRDFDTLPAQHRLGSRTAGTWATLAGPGPLGHPGYFSVPKFPHL